jgi:uncharacterized protein YcbX
MTTPEQERMTTAECQVEGLFVYPFKSARGHAVSTARLASTGFEWDRHWMAVDSHGKFLSQRTHPKLATLVPEITSEALVLRAPELPELRVPLHGGTGASVTVRVWDDHCTAIDQGDDAAQWLSGFLGQPLRMVRILSQPDRLANPKYAGPEPKPVTFVDGFQMLVCNRASLEDLNSRMPEPVPMERFRPNIVLGGLSAFAEDRIDSLHVGDITLRLVKPCTRCVITSTDQQTGRLSTNPLPVLRTFRWDRTLHGVAFGENAVIASGHGSDLRVGCILKVTFEA